MRRRAKLRGILILSAFLALQLFLDGNPEKLSPE
jgi:hypothetical protein